MRARGFFFLLGWLAATPAALRAQEPGYPRYCCTDAGRIGPFENGTVNAGERCSVLDTAGVRHVGFACHGPLSPAMLGPMETRGYADRCCTDVGVLGPFRDARWQEGDRCSAQAEDGQRYDGVACYGVSGLLDRARRDGRLLAAAHHGSCAENGGVRSGLAAAIQGSPGAAPRTGSR
jgi:hypothetical protein